MPAEQAMAVGFLTTLARVSGVLAFAPLPGLRNVMEPCRAVFALALTVILHPWWPDFSGEFPSLGRLIVVLAGEAVFGLAASLVLAFLVEGFLIGAQFIALQAGYSYASTVDPTSQADTGVLQVMAHLLASLLFLAAGLDREVVRALALSFDRFPPGNLHLTAARLGPILDFGTVAWNVGARLALPSISVLLLTDIALALTGRIQAQLQLLSVSFPVKVLATMAVLAAAAGSFPLLFRDAAEQAGRAALAAAGAH